MTIDISKGSAEHSLTPQESDGASRIPKLAAPARRLPKENTLRILSVSNRFLCTRKASLSARVCL